MMQRLLILILGILGLFLLFTCQQPLSIEQAKMNYSKQNYDLNGKIQININPQEENNSRGIDVTEFTVTALDIVIKSVSNPSDIRNFHWVPENADQTFIATIYKEGQYEISVTHTGVNGEQTVTYSESVIVTVKRLKILTINIIPGAVGQIAIEPELVEISGLLKWVKPSPESPAGSGYYTLFNIGDMSQTDIILNSVEDETSDSMIVLLNKSENVINFGDYLNQFIKVTGYFGKKIIEDNVFKDKYTIFVQSIVIQENITINGNGTIVRYKDGVFYLLPDEGGSFNLTNLADSFKIDGLRVTYNIRLLNNTLAEIIDLVNLGEPLAFTTVDKSFYSNVYNAKHEIINNTDNTVIGVYMGEQCSGGYSIDIISVTKNINRNGVTIDVVVKEVYPSIDQYVTDVLTQPYHIIQLPFINGDINFKFFKIE